MDDFSASKKEDGLICGSPYMWEHILLSEMFDCNDEIDGVDKERNNSHKPECWLQSSLTFHCRRRIS